MESEKKASRAIGERNCFIICICWGDLFEMIAGADLFPFSFGGHMMQYILNDPVEFFLLPVITELTQGLKVKEGSLIDPGLQVSDLRRDLNVRAVLRGAQAAKQLILLLFHFCPVLIHE